MSLISNAILALLRHPGQLAALRADPGLAAGAVEETLRYDAPVQFTARTARGGTQVGALACPTALSCCSCSRRRGATLRCSAPGQLDIRRPAGNHLAFAAGPHFCLGERWPGWRRRSWLQAFATRVTGPELDPAGLAYKPNLNLRGPQRLAVRFGSIQPR